MNKARRIADHRTPLLFEHWYVGALSEQIDQRLSERWMLGRSTLLYRKKSGEVVALQNRCPHRSVPLSRGERDGDAVVCGYHGLTFNADGRCIRIPSQQSTGDLRITAYPVVESHPFIWIWMGSCAPVDGPPAAPWLSDPKYTNVAGVSTLSAVISGCTRMCWI